MWLICFIPLGTNNFAPQMLCNTEQEAREWVKNAPFSVVGSYVYMFVPLSRPTGYFQRQEQLPARRQWQIEIGDWPGQPPLYNR